MTTPDKEEMPTDRTAGPWIVHYGEAVKIKDANGYTVASLSQIHLHGRRSKNEVEKTAQFIVTACNAYEPMREALAALVADVLDYEQINNLSPSPRRKTCWASTERACALLTSLGSFPARAALSTLPVNDRTPSEALTYAIGALSAIAAEAKKDPQLLHLYGIAQAAIDLAKLGPSGCAEMRGDDLARPANDRHHSGSDSYQADAGAPALSEKVNRAAEWLPIESAPKDGTEILAFCPDRGIRETRMGLYGPGSIGYHRWEQGEGPRNYGWDWIEVVHNSGHTWKPTHWMPLPSPPGAELNFSNEAERDAVSLKPDTSSQPAIEAGKLSTDTGEVA